MAMDSTWGSDHLARNEVFRTQLKEMLVDPTFAQQWVNWLSDFPDGYNFKISSIGELGIDQREEGVQLPERRVDTGQFIFNIDQHVGNLTAFTDEFMEDDFLAPQVMTKTPERMKRALDQYMETEILKLQRKQVLNDANIINNASHRLLASGAAQELTLQDFAYASFALDKANVAQSGRIALVTPEMEFNLNVTQSIVQIANNPMWEGIVTTGMGDMSGTRFIRNIYGFDVYVSHFTDASLSAEAALRDYSGAGTGSTAGDRANLFFSVADAETSPFVGAWRRNPEVESWRDHGKKTEYHQLTARFGLDLYRPESLLTILSSETLV